MPTTPGAKTKNDASTSRWRTSTTTKRPTNRTDDGDASELIQELTPAVVDGAGKRYVARVLGERDDIGRWRGWLEFDSQFVVFQRVHDAEPEAKVSLQ